MQPRIWGPPTWRVLHGLGEIMQALPFGHRAARKCRKCILKVIESLAEVLPCSLCRGSFRGFDATLTTFKRHQDFRGYFHALHDLVNNKLGKGRGPSKDVLATTVACYNIAEVPMLHVGDVWIMLYIFGTCADALPEPSSECTLRRAAFIVFARNVGAVLLFSNHGSHVRMGEALTEHFQYATSDVRMSWVLSNASQVTEDRIRHIGRMALVRPTG